MRSRTKPTPWLKLHFDRAPFFMAQVHSKSKPARAPMRSIARPQLAAALKIARKHKAPIIVAKLDRLSRQV
jgi:hypothetical protein